MKNIILVFSILFSFNMSARNAVVNEIIAGAVSGQVLDKTTNQALPYVSVVIKDNKNKSITGGVTDDEGNFLIKKIPKGDFVVEVSFMGYETYERKIKISKSRSKFNLGKIYLSETSSSLDEVVVIAEASTVVQKIDRKVINVGKDLTSAGSTASQLLNNVQSVSVDSQTGNISLRGNENVRVLVDGKPTNVNTAQLLKQIPSTSIKSIELITNPSAKYNPEGMSGVINIILHKNSNLGFNGSVNIGVTRGVNTRKNGSVDMNFRTGKVNFFANYGYNDGKSDNFGKVTRSTANLIQDFTFDFDNTSHLLKAGADVYINDKNTFSFYTTQNNSDNLSLGSTKITRNGGLETNSPVISAKENTSQAYNFNYTLNFDKEGENLELEANISTNKNPEIATSQELIRVNDLINNYGNNVKIDNGTQLYNLDYTNPLSETSKIELGLEARFTTTSNSSDTEQHEFVYDNNGDRILDVAGKGWYNGQWYRTTEKENSSFDYDREIYSAYINYNQKFDKLSMQVGARLEHYKVTGKFNTESESEPYSDKIFSVYPSVFFTYNPSDKNQFQLSYSRRVDRPSIGQVNPIREWSTPLLTSVGNPELNPQFTNSYEVNYTYQYPKGSLTFGTFYRDVNDNITRILNRDPLEEEKIELSFMNSASSSRYGVELSSNHAFKNWWRMNASMDLYVEKESGLSDNKLVEVTNNAYNIRVNNSFTATKNLRFQLFGMYRGGGQSIQFKVDPMWMVNTGASLNVLKGKGTVSLNVNDIFKGMKFKFDSETPIKQNGQFNWESRTVYLGFMYRFGGGKNKAKSRKRRDDNETKSSGGFI